LCCPAELKEDRLGQAEFTGYLTNLEQQRADLQRRLDANQAWVDSFEANKDNGAFEAQYRRLLEDIQQIYESAKEFHSKVRVPARVCLGAVHALHSARRGADAARACVACA
jgi:hypothetical protein